MSKENKTASEKASKKNKKKIEQSSEIKSLKSKIRKCEKEIKLLKKEKEELKDRHLRIVAEMENLRKRLEREKKDYFQYNLSDFMKELIVVLDNFERALGDKNNSNDNSFRQGMELIHKQYLDLLKKRGLKPIEIMDKKFDPYLQQAFMTEESEDVKEPEVGEELQKGYSLHDRLLRPTLVKVIVPKKDK